MVIPQLPGGRLDIMSSNRKRRVDTMSSSSGDKQTRRRILDVTLDLVARRGGADVTMAQIARAARVSRQAVYLHFADRAALFTAAVADLEQRRGLPRAGQRVDGSAGPRATNPG